MITINNIDLDTATKIKCLGVILEEKLDPYSMW